MPDGQTHNTPQAVTEIFGFNARRTLAGELSWLNLNPTRILGLSIHSSEYGHLSQPGGPERSPVEGLDINDKVFLTARAKAGHGPKGQPDALIAIVHEVSVAALNEFRFGDYADNLDEFSGDSVGLSLLEIDVRLGNPSAVNMLRLLVVPPAATVPEPWEGWIGPEPVDPDPFDFPDADG